MVIVICDATCGDELSLLCNRSKLDGRIRIVAPSSELEGLRPARLAFFVAAIAIHVNPVLVVGAPNLQVLQNYLMDESCLERHVT